MNECQHDWKYKHISRLLYGLECKDCGAKTAAETRELRFNLSGPFDDTEAARMLNRVEAQEHEGPRPQS